MCVSRKSNFVDLWRPMCPEFLNRSGPKSMDTVAHIGNNSDSNSINVQQIPMIDARNKDGNTPLHLTAMAIPWRPDIAICLLEAGAHIDIANNESKTFEMLLHDKHYYYMVNPLKYITLACLAARVVKKTHRMEAVPKCLQDFVEMH